jgi:hypothetical protein
MRAKEFIFENNELNAYAKQMSEKYGVPFSLVQHAMHKETGHIQDPNQRAKAVSKKGAGGIMQLMPATAKGLGVTDRFDPYQNIEGGTKYLSQLYQKYKDPVLALAAYNAGPANVDKYKGVPPFKQTQNYVSGYDPNIDKVVQKPKTVAPVPTQPSFKDAFKNVGQTIVSKNEPTDASMTPAQSKIIKPMKPIEPLAAVNATDDEVEV